MSECLHQWCGRPYCVIVGVWRYLLNDIKVRSPHFFFLQNCNKPFKIFRREDNNNLTR